MHGVSSPLTLGELRRACNAGSLTLVSPPVIRWTPAIEDGGLNTKRADPRASAVLLHKAAVKALSRLCLTSG